MKGNSPNQNQSTFFYQGFKEILNPKEPLYQLSDKIPWGEIEKEFERYYVNFGRAAKPVRLMVSLLLLKQIYNLGDKTVVESWVQNPYWQYFSGYTMFQWKFPIDPTDVKLHKKIIDKCVKIALEEDIELRQSYRRISKQLVIDQRGNRSKKGKAKARKSAKKL